MHKRARARRQLLTSPPPIPATTWGAGDGSQRQQFQQQQQQQQRGTILSPVSSACLKLDTLHHWSASPGEAQGEGSLDTSSHRGSGIAKTPHPRTAEPGDRRPHHHPMTTASAVHTPAYPHHHQQSRGDFENDNEGMADFRRNVAPIRSTSGLTFAEVLARNASGTWGLTFVAHSRPRRSPPVMTLPTPKPRPPPLLSDF